MPPIISFLDFTTAAPPTPTALQTMQWVLTTSSSGTVASTGLEIVDPNRTNQLQIISGPRFWNGSHALTATTPASLVSGKYRFPTGADGIDWWTNNFQGRIRQNGRDWMVMDGQTAGEIYFSGPMKDYNNIGGGAIPSFWGDWWISQAQGQTFDIELYTKGQIPDNWYTYEEGAGTIYRFSTSATNIDYNSLYPSTTPATQAMAFNTSSGTWPYLYAPRTNFTTTANHPLMAAYIAIYVTDAEEANPPGAGRGNAEGWYVFENDGPQIPGSNSSVQYLPHAWPTGCKSTDGHLDLNSSGFYNGVVYLSNYTGSTGLGGTDNWSAPIGSLLDWDNSGYVGAYAGTTTHVQGVGVQYISDPGIWDPYSNPAGGPMEVEELNWANADSLSVKMTATVNTDTGSPAFPWCAYWNTGDNKWRKGQASARGPFKTDMIYTGMVDLTFNGMDDQPAAMLLFELDPGDVSKWRPYDGPTS